MFKSSELKPFSVNLCAYLRAPLWLKKLRAYPNKYENNSSTFRMGIILMP